MLFPSEDPEILCGTSEWPQPGPGVTGTSAPPPLDTDYQSWKAAKLSGSANPFHSATLSDTVSAHACPLGHLNNFTGASEPEGGRTTTALETLGVLRACLPCLWLPGTNWSAGPAVSGRRGQERQARLALT